MTSPGAVAPLAAPELVLGSTVPRRFTPPLVQGTPGPCGCGCALTEASSYGFAVDSFAREVLLAPLDPWQRWLVIHAGELRPDGSPRFRRVLVLVARQNGKTHCLVVLSLYWMFVECLPMILGTSTKTNYAKESWQKAYDLAKNIEELAAEIPARGGIRKAAGEEEWCTTTGSRYKIAASNEEGGRSLTLHRVIADELRQHHDYSAYNAMYYAMSAVREAQFFALSNAGDDRSVVLNDLRKDALDFINTGEGDDSLGLMEWSAPKDSSPTDPHALAQANPNVGRRLDMRHLLNAARQAAKSGGQMLTGFKTESMCIRVKHLNPAIDSELWAAGLIVAPMPVFNRALCLDVSPDMQHATLCCAAVDDGKVRLEIVASWSGIDATHKLRKELPGWVAKLKPKVLGWFPSGPAAAITADIKERPQGAVSAPWPPRGVKVEEIRGEMSAACMGFAEQVAVKQVLHSGDELLNAHVLGVEPLKRGDSWVFSRKGEGNCDAAYAAAGSMHLVRTLPNAPAGIRLIGPRTDSPT